VTARYEFIHQEKASFPVSSMCRALEVSASGYYDWMNRGPSERQRRREDLALKVKAVHQRSNGTYGSPRVHEQLVRMGETVAEKTVAGIMQQEGLRPRRLKVSPSFPGSGIVAAPRLPPSFHILRHRIS